MGYVSHVFYGVKMNNRDQEREQEIATFEAERNAAWASYSETRKIRHNCMNEDHYEQLERLFWAGFERGYHRIYGGGKG